MADTWLDKSRTTGQDTEPNPWGEGDVRPGEGGEGPDGGGTQPPPGWDTEWAGDFWKRMLAALGVVQSTVPGEKEWGYDKYGRVAMDPAVSRKLGTGWDTSEVWVTGSPETGYQQRYAEGEIPDFMKAAMGRFTDMKASGALTQKDLDMLADHWVRGIGVDPVWQKAFAAQPAWATQVLRDFFRGLGATSV